LIVRSKSSVTARLYLRIFERRLIVT